MQIHQSVTDSVLASMVLLPKTYLKNTTPSTFFVDMRDFDYVDFVIMLGATDCRVDAKAQESAGADGGTPTDVIGAAITQIAANGDNRQVVLSVRKETTTKRYVGVLLTTFNEGTSADLAVEAIRYRKVGNLPVPQSPAGTYTYLTGEVIKV